MCLLLALPPIFNSLTARVRRDRSPTSLLAPSLECLVIASFPIAWFFAFLYYTELGSLVFALMTILMALRQRHWEAALVRPVSCCVVGPQTNLYTCIQYGLVSCTFRQTNIIWLFYALGVSCLSLARSQPSDVKPLYDPPAEEASLSTGCPSVRCSSSSSFLSEDDILPIGLSLPNFLLQPRILRNAIPYSMVLALFGLFVAWNGGIVLGMYIPQDHRNFS